MWPPSSPDLNPMDFYVLGVVGKETNKHPHSTKELLKATILHVMGIGQFAGGTTDLRVQSVP